MSTNAISDFERRYDLGDAVGRGGMADVLRAFDRALERTVAVKIMRVGEAADPERFSFEMRILARLDHKAIVQVYDAGATPEGRPFFVMPLVEGQSLAQLIRAAGGLAPDLVRSVGGRVASALAYAHAKSVVHRDIKPANILIDPEGLAYLTDFGVARLTDATVVTQEGTTIGTAAYLAPEQLQESAVGPEADVYSLGLVLLEALTGVRSFEGTGVETAMARLAREPDIAEDLPYPWTLLLRAMTRREPERRIDAAGVEDILEGRKPPPPCEPPPQSSLDSSLESAANQAVDGEAPTVAPPAEPDTHAPFDEAPLTPPPTPPPRTLPTSTMPAGTALPLTPPPGARVPFDDTPTMPPTPPAAWPVPAADTGAEATAPGETSDPGAAPDGARPPEEGLLAAIRRRPLIAGMALGALAVGVILAIALALLTGPMNQGPDAAVERPSEAASAEARLISEAVLDVTEQINAIGRTEGSNEEYLTELTQAWSAANAAIVDGRRTEAQDLVRETLLVAERGNAEGLLTLEVFEPLRDALNVLSDQLVATSE